jgi:hypothetical protein
MRYLKFQERGSRLEREFTSLSRSLEQHPALRALISATKGQHGDSWVVGAMEQMSRWASWDHESALARLCFLWFTGRQGDADKMQQAIDQSCRWLERHPDEALVRWAALWLDGILEREPHPLLVEGTAKWLRIKSADDERLVRMGFLWLVGAKGSQPQILDATAHTAAWLEAHTDDDFIRVAYLLFLIRRTCKAEERRRVAGATREWLCHHPDIHGITDTALRLFESAP